VSFKGGWFSLVACLSAISDLPLLQGVLCFWKSLSLLSCVARASAYIHSGCQNRKMFAWNYQFVQFNCVL